MQNTWLEKKLLWLQQKTNIDTKYLFKNGGYVFATQAVAAITGFATFIIVGRWLPSEVYGQYKYFLSLHAMFAVFTLTGMEYALGKAVANNKDASTSIALKTKLKFSLIGSCVAFIVAYLQWMRHENATAQALLLIGLLSPWIYAFALYSQLLIGKKKFNHYARAVILSNITTFIPMLFAFWYTKNPVVLFSIYLFSNFTNIGMYWYAKKFISIKDTQPDQNLIPYAKHVSAVDALGTIANAVDAAIVYHLLGPEMLAIYALAILPVEQIRGMLKSVQTIATPKFAAQDFLTVASSLKRKVLYFIGFTTCIAALYVFVSPIFYQTVLPKYLASARFSQLYSISLIFAAPASLLYTLFLSQGLKEKITIFNLVTYTLQIITLIILSGLYGIYGTVIARLFTFISMFFITYWLAFHHKNNKKY